MFAGVYLVVVVVVVVVVVTNFTFLSAPLDPQVAKQQDIQIAK